MDNFQDFLRQLGERFNQLSQGKKVAALSLVALALASLVVMSLWLKSPDYQLLYANLSNEDAGAIIENLKGQKVIRFEEDPKTSSRDMASPEDIV